MKHGVVVIEQNRMKFLFNFFFFLVQLNSGDCFAAKLKSTKRIDTRNLI
jgi:hypothetical protein